MRLLDITCKKLVVGRNIQSLEMMVGLENNIFFHVILVRNNCLTV